VQGMELIVSAATIAFAAQLSSMDAIAMVWRVRSSCAWIGLIAANTIRKVRLPMPARQCSQALAGPEARLPPRKNGRRSLRTNGPPLRYKDAMTGVASHKRGFSPGVLRSRWNLSDSVALPDR